MKRALMIIGIILLATSVFAGQGNGDGPKVQAISETGQGIETTNAGQQQTGNQATDTQIQVQAQEIQQVKAQIKTKQAEMQQEMAQQGSKEQKVYMNQNQVRLAVHSLLAMEDLTGGIGPQVREVARNFNNSVQATIKAEEKIQTRSGVAKFFAGGDAEAAANIEEKVNENKLMIQNLKQLKEQCDCGNEIKEMMQEQIQIMEQEQDRLGALAQEEKKKKGLFGWLWK